MQMPLTKKHIVLLTLLVSLLFTGCSASAEQSEPGGDWNNEKYVDICLDGKVSQYDDAGNLVPVANIMVTMIDADGKTILSTRTKEFGRFLIEVNGVKVGYDWDKYIFVEIIDDPARIGYTDENELSYKYIKKTINAAPSNMAVLTMDDIVMERINKQGN